MRQKYICLFILLSIKLASQINSVNNTWSVWESHDRNCLAGIRISYKFYQWMDVSGPLAGKTTGYYRVRNDYNVTIYLRVVMDSRNHRNSNMQAISISPGEVFESEDVLHTADKSYDIRIEKVRVSPDNKDYMGCDGSVEKEDEEVVEKQVNTKESNKAKTIKANTNTSTANSNQNNSQSSAVTSGGFYVDKLEKGQPFFSHGNDGKYWVLNDMKEKPYKYVYNDGLGRWVLKEEYITTSKKYRGEEPPEYYAKLDKQTNSTNNVGETSSDKVKTNAPKPGKYDNVKILNENNNFDFGDHTTTGSYVGDYLQEVKNDYQNQLMNNSINNIAKDFNEDMKGTGLQKAVGQLNDWSKPVDVFNDSGKDLAGKMSFGLFKEGLSAYSEIQKENAAAEEQQRQERLKKQKEAKIINAKKEFYSNQAKKIKSLIYYSLNKNEENYYQLCYDNSKACHDQVTIDSECNPTNGLSPPTHSVISEDLNGTYSLFLSKIKLFSQLVTKSGYGSNVSTSTLAYMLKGKGYEDANVKGNPDESNSISSDDKEILEKSILEIITEVRKKYPNQQISYFMGYSYYLSKDANLLAAYMELNKAISNLKSNYKTELNLNLESKYKENAIGELESKKTFLTNEIVKNIKLDIGRDNVTSINNLKEQGILSSFNSNDELSKHALMTNAAGCLKILTSKYTDTWPGFEENLINAQIAANRANVLVDYYTSKESNKNKLNAATDDGKALVDRAIKERKEIILFFCEKHQGINIDKEFEKQLKSSKDDALVIAHFYLNKLLYQKKDEDYNRLVDASIKLFGDKRLLKTYTFYDDVNILKSACIYKNDYVLSKLASEYNDDEYKTEVGFFNSFLSGFINLRNTLAVNSFYNFFKGKPKMVNKETLELSYKNEFSGHAQLMDMAQPEILYIDSYKDNYLQKSVIEGKSHLAKQIISNKSVDLNYKNSYANNALILACQKEDFYLVNLLLENGADPNAKCQEGFTPLMVAVKKYNKELASLLIAKNSDPSIKNNKQLDCFDIIDSEVKYKDSKQMVKILKTKK